MGAALEKAKRLYIYMDVRTQIPHLWKICWNEAMKSIGSPPSATDPPGEAQRSNTSNSTDHTHIHLRHSTAEQRTPPAPRFVFTCVSQLTYVFISWLSLMFLQILNF